MLDKYKDSQFVAYSLLFNAIKNNKLSHAYLIETRNCSNVDVVINNFVRILYSKYTGEDNKSLLSLQEMINNGNYIEIKSNSDTSIIKKDQVISIQEKFMTKAWDNNNRIYSANLKFKINGAEQTPTFNSTTGLYTVKYTPSSLDSISVNASCSNVDILDEDNDPILVKTITDLIVNCSDSAVYGSEFKVNATLDSTISGENITFTVLNSTNDPVKSVNTTITGGFASYSFADLPVYSNGNVISYSVQELDVVNYTTTISNDTAYVFTVTNSHVPVVTEVNVTKVWNDSNNQDGVRPESITIRLYADDVEVGSKVVTEADGWKWNFTNLPSVNLKMSE